MLPTTQKCSKPVFHEDYDSCTRLSGVFALLPAIYLLTTLGQFFEKLKASYSLATVGFNCFFQPKVFYRRLNKIF